MTDDDFPALRNRAVRDSLEHVDERIDGYLASKRRPLDLRGIETGVPSAPLHGDPATRSTCGEWTRLAESSKYSDAKGTFDEVHINELVDEMLDIQRRVNAWFNDAPREDQERRT